MITPIEEELVAELRELFLDGATPSFLIQKILEATQTTEDPSSELINQYFCAAFGNQVYQMGTVETSMLATLEHKYLNDDVLHKILQGIGEWKTMTAPGNEHWCDGLQATGIGDKKKEFTSTANPFVAKFWETLDPKAQSFLRSHLINHEIAKEKLCILQQLVERLQQKLIQLEQLVD